VFTGALHDVAVLNGIPAEARSWRHSSIASRSRFLHALAQDPVRTQRFERAVQAIKAGILVSAVVSGAWAAHDLRIWQALLRWLP
jgi:STE24 endopeptidase